MTKQFNMLLKMKNRRSFKNLFLYESFQKRLIGFIVLANFILITLFYLANKYFFYVFISKGKRLGIPPHHIFYQFIDDLQYEMTLIFIITSFLSLIGIVLGAYFISHKISGPLYRLNLELGIMLKNKKLHPLRFRKSDYTLEIQDKFNSLVEAVDENNS